MSNFTEQVSLASVVANTNGDPVNVEGMRGIGIQLEAAAITKGAGAFTFEATIDGTNWVKLYVLITNSTNTIIQGYTRTDLVTLNANGTTIVWLDDAFAAKAIRVVVEITSDGVYSANVIARE